MTGSTAPSGQPPDHPPAARSVRPPLANRVVGTILRSPAHRILSGSTDLIRYRGVRSGTDHVTPTQYARVGEDVVILVGKPDTKQWWRNFRSPQPLDVLLAREWHPMIGTALDGRVDSEPVVPALAAYLERFPRVARTLDGEAVEDQARRCVVVRCTPRGPGSTGEG